MTTAKLLGLSPIDGTLTTLRVAAAPYGLHIEYNDDTANYEVVLTRTDMVFALNPLSAFRGVDIASAEDERWFIERHSLVPETWIMRTTPKE